jgi:hypothetical protein
MDMRVEKKETRLRCSEHIRNHVLGYLAPTRAIVGAVALIACGVMSIGYCSIRYQHSNLNNYTAQSWFRTTYFNLLANWYSLHTVPTLFSKTGFIEAGPNPEKQIVPQTKVRVKEKCGRLIQDWKTTSSRKFLIQTRVLHDRFASPMKSGE